MAANSNRLDQAEQWYLHELAISSQLGDKAGVGAAYYGLGLVAWKKEQLPAALTWTVKCVAQFDEFPHPEAGPAPERLVELTGLAGLPALAQTWREVTGQELPDEIRAYVESRIREGDGP